ncbi:MAG: glutaredoxin domain-containing protein [Candidatus Micrarchaeia archaeon]
MDSTDSELELIRHKKILEMSRKAEEKQKVNNMDVKVYTTQTCPYCSMAKRYLESKGVQYKEVDVSRDFNAAQEMISKSGQMGVPQLEINGQMVIGFDREGIDRALTKPATKEFFKERYGL